MVKKQTGLIIILLFLASCSSNATKIQWEGELINKSHDSNYIYWNDGNQFLTIEQDSMSVSLAGFEFEHAIYILVSLTNLQYHPYTFFTKQARLKYTSKNSKIELLPVNPKNLEEEHFSFFNTIIDGAGRISRLFLNIPMDALLNTEKDENNPQKKIGGYYHDDDFNMTKKLFMSNHTLFSGTNYAGFLVFEYDSNFPIMDGNFEFIIKMDNTINAKGSFLK